MNFCGIPYPIEPHPMGFLRSQCGLDQIKSDLLVLLLTNPGERIMMPEFGTPLRTLMFEPNDSNLHMQARSMIIRAIDQWEPRVVGTVVVVGTTSFLFMSSVVAVATRAISTKSDEMSSFLLCFFL